MMLERIARLAVAAGMLAITANADSNDWQIVPGRRAGPISPRTTRADLDRFFGAKNVADEDVTIGDNGPEPGTMVFEDDPERALTIVWNEDTPAPHIRAIVFCQESLPPNGCRWHTPEGVTFGTDLKMLEKINGRKFKLYGLGWDYGGMVTSWERGVLERLNTACGRVSVQLEEPAGSPSEKRTQLIEEVQSEREFWSSDASMQALNPTIDYMSMSFESCETGK